MSLSSAAVILLGILGVFTTGAYLSQSIVAYFAVAMIAIFIGLQVWKSNSSDTKWSLDDKENDKFLLIEVSFIGITFLVFTNIIVNNVI